LLVTVPVVDVNVKWPVALNVSGAEGVLFENHRRGDPWSLFERKSTHREAMLDSELQTKLDFCHSHCRGVQSTTQNELSPMSALHSKPRRLANSASGMAKHRPRGSSGSAPANR